MADSCIVCFEELDALPGPGVRDDLQDAGEVADLVPPVATTHPGNESIQQTIAVIQPCKHFLHDECLREWSHKANSCPFCRQQFNLVHVLDRVGGTIISEYEVEDKKQVAEFDPNAWVEEEEEEEEDVQPCPVCEESDQPEVLLLCDACDTPYHTHCIGLDRVPTGHWFCMECAHDGAYQRAASINQEPAHQSTTPGQTAPTTQSPRIQAPRTQASERRSRQRTRADHWTGAWSVLSSRLHNHADIDLDLDFLDDDHDQSLQNYRALQTRTDRERRERRQWQRRINIASYQGAGDIFRASAPARLRNPTPQPPAETVEESKAWGAFEEAQKADSSTPRTNKRKSRSVDASPAEAQEPERKLKRPRTRRILDNSESSSVLPAIASSSRNQISLSRPGSPTSRILNGSDGQPSFLSNLLKEVEMTSGSDDDRSAFSSTTISGHNRCTSPSLDYSSPAASPGSSTSYHTPRASSSTPPPNGTKRSNSPFSLSSRVEPNYSRAEYSPSRSPPNRERSQTGRHGTHVRQPRPQRPHSMALPRSEETSPERGTMSIEAKQGINKIVKNALAPLWRSAEITKEQYANINRDVSRKLYGIVANRSIDDDQQKDAWEKIALAEVSTAVKSLAT